MPTAFISALMNKLCYLVLDALLLFITAVAFLVAIFTSCGLIVLLVIRLQDGQLMDSESHVVVIAAEWLAGSAAIMGAMLWIRRRTVPVESRGESFRLTESKPSRVGQRLELCFDAMLLTIFGFLVWGVAQGSPIAKASTVAFALVAGYVTTHGRILFHEMGHFLAARVLRFDRYKIQVGTGPLLWSHSFKSGLLFEWRASVRAGFVVALPRTDRRVRLRQFLFVIGGPAADLLLILAGYKLITHLYGGLSAGFESGTVGFVIVVLFWFTAWSAISGLIPHKIRINARELWTDGYWILRICFAPNASRQEWALYFSRQKALEILKSESTPPVVIESKVLGNPPPIEAFREQRTRLTSFLLGKRKPDCSEPLANLSD